MDKKFVLRTSAGREYPIVGFTRIGRDADCLIRYADPAISGHHANVWVVQDGLWLKDDNSSGGVYVNGQRIALGQSYRLRPGDRLRLGNTQIELDVVWQATARPTTPTTSARRLMPITCAAILGCLFVFGLVALSTSYFIFGERIAGLVSGQAKVISISTPQTLLKPQEYVASGQSLAQAVAQLNQSELAFIQAASETKSYLPKSLLARLTFPVLAADPLDENLRQVAADAFHVATLADSLSRTAVAQDGGSQQAGDVASQYSSVAQLGAALVIDAQYLREELGQGRMTQAEAAAAVAEYGARLWNPAVTDPTGTGNPFSAYLGNPAAIPVAQPLSSENTAQVTAKIGPGSSAWVATSGQKITKKLSFPGEAAGNLNDPALTEKMSTAAGQADGTAAKQAAASILQAEGGSVSMGEPPTGGQVVASFYSAAAVSSTEEKPGVTPPRTMSVFPTGPATIITQPPSNDTIANLLTFDNTNNPTVAGQIPVDETKPLVSLDISNVSIKAINKRAKDAFNTFEADVVYEFDVKWTSNLAAPQFTLECVSGNHFDVSTGAGSQHITAKGLLILYPGAEDAYCYASRNGNTWGSASVHFLVGDTAEATQRAIQVETDSASLDLTLTADAQGTLMIQNANAAATKTAIAIENAVSTEVYGTQTAEFIAQITEIARQTRDAPTPADTLTPLPTSTFTPVLVETLFHPGDVHTIVGRVRLQKGRLYRICLSGTMYTTDGPVYPSDVDYVNGIKVPLSGCVVLGGGGAVATISCSKGVPAEDPGGFTVQIFDLGPE